MTDQDSTHTSGSESPTRSGSFSDDVVKSPEEITAKKTYKVYTRRWAVLFTVTLMHISNASLWISISPVATKVAEYYEREVWQINFFSLVFFIVYIPFSFVSTFCVNKFGLMPSIHIGSALNCIGGLIRALGSSGIIKDNLDAEFAISLTGQVIAGTAQSFILFIPTKVSHLWFPDDARTISTTILTLSNAFGIVVAQVTAPRIVNDKEDYPTLNWVFGGLALVTEVITIICVTRSRPPTPPSAGAENDSTLKKEPYLKQLKEVFTSFPFVFLMVVHGSGLAFFTSLSTLTQQLLCPLGYSDDFSGLSNAVMVLCGLVGSVVASLTVDRTKKFIPILKLCYALATISAIMLSESYLWPDKEGLIATFSAFFGFFGIGSYPLGLELAVEATYPVDQTISTAFVFMFGQLMGVVIIAMVGGLSRDQKARYDDIQVCTKSETSKVEPKDYTVSLIAVMCLLTAAAVTSILFYSTPYKRLEAERTATKASEATEKISRKKSETSSQADDGETICDGEDIQSRF